jgi:hypothetical protein
MKWLLALLFSLSLYDSFAQVEDSGSVYLSKAIYAQQTKFQEAMNTLAPLYNGAAYVRYWNKEIGHPFFESDQLQKSNICFKGFIYREVPLKYDLLKNQLIIKNATGEFEMELLKEYISAFSIGSHEFIKIVEDSINADMSGNGFYELLYNGKSAVIAKYYKRVEASLKAEENTSKFVQYASYYVRVNNGYHLIENNADFLKFHKEQKVGLKKYLNKEKLQFSKMPAKTLVSIATYFDSIANE